MSLSKRSCSSASRVRVSGVSLTCGWIPIPPGRNSWNTEGYFRMKSMGRVGIPNEDLLLEMMEIGRDFDGSELMRFLTLIMGLRSRSFSTAWSSARSRTHLIEETTESLKAW
ncbi:hypothetical protein R6Q59_036412 [Mikania micrantha]